MDRAALIDRRLRTQRVAGAPFASPEEMVRALVCVQSQDYAGARWSVGQRVAGGTEALVSRAFDAGRILRTHILRPTWHFVDPDDIRWILELTAPRVRALNAYMYRQSGLDDVLFARSRALLVDALADGRPRTRTELATLLAGAGIVADGFRLAYIVMDAELEGLICSGPLRGKQHTYALLAARAPAARTLPREAALAELARRFFAGHGPATLRDYATWSGLTLAEAREGLALAAPDLESATVEGHEHWFGEVPAVSPPADPVAYLLPEYDEAVLTFKDLNLPPLPGAPAGAPPYDTFFRPIVIDGAQAGTWRRIVAGRAARIEASLAGPLNERQMAALEAAVARYGAYIGRPATLAIIDSASAGQQAPVEGEGE